MISAIDIHGHIVEKIFQIYFNQKIFSEEISVKINEDYNFDENIDHPSKFAHILYSKNIVLDKESYARAISKVNILDIQSFMSEYLNKEYRSNNIETEVKRIEFNTEDRRSSWIDIKIGINLKGENKEIIIPKKSNQKGLMIFEKRYLEGIHITDILTPIKNHFGEIYSSTPENFDLFLYSKLKSNHQYVTEIYFSSKLHVILEQRQELLENLNIHSLKTTIERHIKNIVNNTPIIKIEQLKFKDRLIDLKIKITQDNAW